MKKKVLFDKRASKEFRKFPGEVRAKGLALIDKLSSEGTLIEPYGKKLSSELFEIRIKYQGQWRLIYAYLIDDEIVILSAFQKKSQKTPIQELSRAIKRLKEHQI